MENCFSIIEETNLIIIEDNNDLLVFINILELITTESSKTITTTIDNNLILPSDGWYKITRLGFPKEAEYFKLNTYYYNNGIFKITEGGLTYKIPLEEVLEVNPNTTNITYAEEEIFNTGNLELCLLKLHDSIVVRCGENTDPCNPENCIRNHVWHLLNTINYYVNCNQPEEAQRLLELFNKCFNYCSKSSSCHCIKKCGCNG